MTRYETALALAEMSQLKAQHRAQRDALLARLAREGESTAVIALRVGLSRYVVGRMLRQLGLRGCR